tara:strand:+ start:147 stop:296 length:150 start_codon:yes stop_codon:yes gene_type:complete
MNGAAADPPPITIRIPNKSKTKSMGIIQNFFLSLIKFQKSDKKFILKYN